MAVVPDSIFGLAFAHPAGVGRRPEREPIFCAALDGRRNGQFGAAKDLCSPGHWHLERAISSVRHGARHPGSAAVAVPICLPACRLEPRVSRMKHVSFRVVMSLARCLLRVPAATIVKGGDGSGRSSRGGTGCGGHWNAVDMSLDAGIALGNPESRVEASLPPQARVRSRGEAQLVQIAAGREQRSNHVRCQGKDGGSDHTQPQTGLHMLTGRDGRPTGGWVMQ